MTGWSYGVRRARGAATALLVLVTLLGCTDTDEAAPRATPSPESSPAATLEGFWQVEELVVPDAQPTMSEHPPPTLSVDVEGPRRISFDGLNACNRYQGQAVVGEGTIDLGAEGPDPGFFITEEGCPDDPYAAPFTSVWTQLAADGGTWRVDDGRLELSAGEGRWRITFSQP